MEGGFVVRVLAAIDVARGADAQRPLVAVVLAHRLGHGLAAGDHVLRRIADDVAAIEPRDRPDVGQYRTHGSAAAAAPGAPPGTRPCRPDRKSTRLNSSH